MLVSWLAERKTTPTSGCSSGSTETAATVGDRPERSGPTRPCGGLERALRATIPTQMAATLDEWTEYFAALDAGWITEGAVLMRKHDRGHNIVRADPVDEEELEFASDQIERVFAALASSPSPAPTRSSRRG